MRLPPVLIIGAHRSGTTATARALELLGLEIGQRLDSHRESKPLQRLHDEYLQRCGASWFNPDAFLQRLDSKEEAKAAADFLGQASQHRFSEIFGYRGLNGWWRKRRVDRGKAWGWKEPRTTLFARAWLRVFPEARVLHVIRHPVSVASSIRQRELRFRAAGDQPKQGLDQLDYCLRLALSYVAAGRVAAKTASHSQEVRFESLQTAPLETLRNLAAFCGLRPNENQLSAAAATIHPPSSPWDRLNPAESAAIQSMADELRRLGYQAAPGTPPQV